ncbi:MAG: sugar transferase [Planctomycetes bacterium]|nr:sugar transferase [Planctomycetota bacterium]
MSLAGTYDLILERASARDDRRLSVESNRPSPRGVSTQASKRVFDVAASILLLAAFLPFLAAAMIFIEATSPGAALFVQWRVGRRGRLFRMFKLRTMVQDAEKGTGPVWAQDRDPRVTPLGRFLRDTHLDELPQLWNVIRGEMSLVGPRPERPLFVQDFTKRIPNYAARMEVRPGITGLAQVYRGYDSTIEDVRRKLAYDLVYIRRMSVLLDLKIMFKTLGKAIPVQLRRNA